MTRASVYGDYAENKADEAAGRTGEERSTDALGEGLAAIAYALLDVASAIREHTESTR